MKRQPLRTAPLALLLALLRPTSSKHASTIDLSSYRNSETKLSDLVDFASYLPPPTRTYDPSSPDDSCFSPLAESDSDGDGKLDREEYLGFVGKMSGALVEEAFRDLPFALKVNFVYLGCLCEGGGTDCCKAGGGAISVEGASPDDAPTDAQLRYLDAVCAATQASIDYALAESPPGPTGTPTESPVLSLGTNAPSSNAVEITEAPTYLEGTEPPVSTPTSSSPTAINIIPPTSAIEPTPSPSSSKAPTPTENLIADVGTEDADRQTETETLSAGGIAGIVIASMAAITAGIILSRKRRRGEEDPSLEVFDRKGDDLEMGATSESGGDGPSPKSTTADAGSAAAIVAPSPSEAEEMPEPYEPSLPPAEGPTPASPAAAAPYSPERFRDVEIDESASNDDSSSSAGQSGWSSSQGLSSLNTASFDAGTDDGLLPLAPPPVSRGSALAAIGAASAITYAVSSEQVDKRPVPRVYSSNNDDDDSISSVDDDGLKGRDAPVTRKDLDAAIEAGDWAAVGATAALLANTTDHGSSSDEPVQGRKIVTRLSSNMDEGRSTELDKMVEAGDWAGVVMAAAQFEGQSESDLGSRDGSHDQLLDDASVPSLLAKGRSDKIESLARIRAEVELLVRRIVPDEIDNIDEMMIQFEGREHELIETLKTMQERSIAQRNRAAVQQSAKLQAIARGQTRDVSGGGSTSTSSASKSFIEMAIEKGDWQAVGEAAAMMGEGSAVIEDDTQNGSHSSSISSSITDSRSRSVSRDSTLSRDKSERIQHLDHLIAAGDWAGIVAAAGEYQAMDEEVGQSPPVDASPASAEERDALAQAELWRAIANQSKQDISSASQGASDAADWAISRSLMKHTASSSNSDEPDAKAAKVEIYEDDLSV